MLIYFQQHDYCIEYHLYLGRAFRPIAGISVGSGCGVSGWDMDGVLLNLLSLFLVVWCLL